MFINETDQSNGSRLVATLTLICSQLHFIGDRLACHRVWDNRFGLGRNMLKKIIVYV